MAVRALPPPYRMSGRRFSHPQITASPLCCVGTGLPAPSRRVSPLPRTCRPQPPESRDLPFSTRANPSWSRISLLKPFLEDPWSSQHVGCKEMGKSRYHRITKKEIGQTDMVGTQETRMLFSYWLRTGFVYLYELVGSQFRDSTGQFRIKRVVE